MTDHHSYGQQTPPLTPVGIAYGIAPLPTDEEIASARRWFMRQYPDTPGPTNLLTAEERREYDRAYMRLEESGLSPSQLHAAAWRAAIGGGVDE